MRPTSFIRSAFGRVLEHQRSREFNIPSLKFDVFEFYCSTGVCRSLGQETHSSLVFRRVEGGKGGCRLLLQSLKILQEKSRSAESFKRTALTFYSRVKASALKRGLSRSHIHTQAAGQRRFM